MMKDIEGYLSTEFIDSAQKCAQRLISHLPNKNNISKNLILLAYGGGKTAVIWFSGSAIFRG